MDTVDKMVTTETKVSLQDKLLVQNSDCSKEGITACKYQSQDSVEMIQETETKLDVIGSSTLPLELELAEESFMLENKDVHAIALDADSSEKVACSFQNKDVQESVTENIVDTQISAADADSNKATGNKIDVMESVDEEAFSPVNVDDSLNMKDSNLKTSEADLKSKETSLASSCSQLGETPLPVILRRPVINCLHLLLLYKF